METCVVEKNVFKVPGKSFYLNRFCSLAFDARYL